MPEEEDDDDKKAAKGGKKEDKKADKGKKDDKKGGKDKGGKDKGGKDKGGKEKGGKDDKGKGGKDKGASKGGSVKGSKPGSSEGSVGKDKDKKDKDQKGKDQKGKDHKGSKESIKSPTIDSAAEPKPEHEKDKPAEKGGGKDHKAEDKPGDGAHPGPGKDHKPEGAKEGGEHKAADEAGKKSGVLSPSGPKEKTVKPDAAEKSAASEKSDKSSIKSDTSVEKTKTETSKTETSEKSSGSKSEVSLEHKKPSIKSHKGGEPPASKTVVRTLTAQGPVYAEHYYDDTDDDGDRNYIEIQMFGRRHSGVDQASPGGQSWNQYYYDMAQQPAYEPPASQRTTASFTHYGSDAAQLQAGGQWSSNQQFVASPDPGGYSEQCSNYGDLTVSVWQAPPQQQGVRMDAGRNVMIAQKLKDMQQGLALPLPDDTVTTERVIYEVTRGPPGSHTLDTSGAPLYRASSGPLVVRSSQGGSQFYGPPGVSQAVVRHEMRQSSATRLQTAGPGGLQVRANSNQGMICNVVPPGPSCMKHESAHSFRLPGGVQSPVSPRASKSGGIQPLPAQQAVDIIKQQASIIERQSNIINQQSSIIDQQLDLVNAALKGGTSAGCRQSREAYQVAQVVPQEFAVPALPGAPPVDGAYDNEMFVSAEFVETNRMSRNPWNRRH